jgi:SAM-dependent methyltransferase
MSTIATTINAETANRHARKYESTNPIQKYLLRRFHLKVRNLLTLVGPRQVLDFGCGEAYFWALQAEFGPLPEVVGLDLRAEAIAVARNRMPGLTFLCEDLFAYDFGDRRFDLVVASETLEHLYDPGRHVRRLCELTEDRLLFTVPHEPFFRLCNFLRGRDVRRWGNHPEHVQRWSRRGFTRFLSRYVEIEAFETSFPFLIALCRRRRQTSAYK